MRFKTNSTKKIMVYFKNIYVKIGLCEEDVIEYMYASSFFKIVWVTFHAAHMPENAFKVFATEK